MTDRLSAFGRGAAQGATAGWGDEAYAALLKAIPFDDGTGIPREYAGGQYEQYRDQARAEDAEAARKFPANFAAGNILGAAPAAIATGGAGGLGTVAGAAGLGAVQGSGASSSKGQELLKDTVRGGALGGAMGAGGNALSTAARTAAPAISRMLQAGPPQGPAPAMATAGSAAAAAPKPKPAPGGVQINRAQSVSDMPMPSRVPAQPPPRRDSLPAMAVPEFPKPGKLPAAISDTEMDIAEARLRQTEDSFAKKHEAKYGAEAQKVRATDTVRPPKGRKASPPPAAEPSGLARVERPAAAPVAPMAQMDRPLMTPKQLPDERILELARAQREAAPPPPPRVPMSQLEKDQAKQMLRDQFKQMASGGNVVEEGGALTVADSPFIAGRIRELQGHRQAALQAGDDPRFFDEQIEELLNYTPED